MVYRFVYTLAAQEDLNGLGKNVSVRILKKLDYFINLSDPLLRAKQLTGFDTPTFRFRVGDYRVVFRKDVRANKLIILVVLKIAHRGEVYRKS